MPPTKPSDLELVPDVGSTFSWYWKEKVGSLEVLDVHITGPAPNDYIVRVRVSIENGSVREHTWIRSEYKGFMWRVMPYRRDRLALLLEG